MRSVIPGLWHPLAYIAGGGMALRWFRDQFYNTQQGSPPLPSEMDIYDQMIEAAAKIPPGAEGLHFSPHLGGRICPATPGDARGVGRLSRGGTRRRISSAPSWRASPTSTRTTCAF